MKKIVYLVVAAATVSVIACTENKYVVTGTIEGANDGDMVYLVVNGQEKLDSTTIKNGAFRFKGTQDTASVRFITMEENGRPSLLAQFFLENGNINISVDEEKKSTISGTPNNDIFQDVQNQMADVHRQIISLYEVYSDSTATDEERDAAVEEIKALQEQIDVITKESTQKNITNPVGLHLFQRTFTRNTIEENEALIEQMPESYQNSEFIITVKEQIDKQKKTAVGTSFVDFEMQNPEGKTVKLSDYVGKGKVVLVDFWASWCGPCRREMPNVIEVYKKYKNKNFEIVGVSLDSKEEDWKDGIKELNLPWPQMSDLQGWKNIGAQNYVVTSIPHTVLIDGEGTIIARGLRGEELEAKLKEIL